MMFLAICYYIKILNFLLDVFVMQNVSYVMLLENYFCKSCDGIGIKVQG